MARAASHRWRGYSSFFLDAQSRAHKEGPWVLHAICFGSSVVFGSACRAQLAAHPSAVQRRPPTPIVGARRMRMPGASSRSTGRCQSPPPPLPEVVQTQLPFLQRHPARYTATAVVIALPIRSCRGSWSRGRKEIVLRAAAMVVLHELIRRARHARQQTNSRAQRAAAQPPATSAPQTGHAAPPMAPTPRKNRRLLHIIPHGDGATTVITLPLPSRSIDACFQR